MFWLHFSTELKPLLPNPGKLANRTVGRLSQAATRLNSLSLDWRDQNYERYTQLFQTEWAFVPHSSQGGRLDPRRDWETVEGQIGL